ncbi:hypothetical protein BTN49_1069 [Candidatus Enterovibrio escicola]|uniref:Uncharacterized protein n=1 Tax=Candidatus Enterovibrio escicola TaxID=1927127 RepID=A0A2A5T4K1_9GAMM|nr:hypothetical protein BTN49_1069 [Candidatus Enterovibrio escacola]
MDITEYQLFYGRCQHCNPLVLTNVPDNAQSGQLGLSST